MAVFLAMIVMPFSRSRSIESMIRSATAWFSRKSPDCQSMASTSVVLPWSTWAMMAMLRMLSRCCICPSYHARAHRLPCWRAPMRMRAVLLVALLCLFTVAGAQAQSLTATKPEQVGLSGERLARLTAWLKTDVEKGVIPGAVLLVARHGKIAMFEAVGARDPESKTPMPKDGIFRIYSMSKPITSVATMILFEEGKLTLDQPVSKYLPQLGGLKVGVEKPDPSGGAPTLDLQASRRDMTVQDLLSHTSGLTYGFFGQGLGRLPDERRARRSAEQAAAGLPAGHDLGLQPLHGRARATDRGHRRHLAPAVREGAHPGSARHEGHGLL